MKESGWIKLDRKILTWEWYDDPYTKALFIHLLLTVNWTDVKWHGMTIHRGERVTSYSKLADELKVSPTTIKRCIKKLRDTHVIHTNSTKNWTLITVENYEKYQAVGHEMTQQVTHDVTQQVTHDVTQQVTTIEERNKNINNIQESKKGAQPVDGPIRKIQHVDNDPAGWLAKTRANIRKVNAEYGFDKGGQLSEVVADGKVFEG